MEELRIQVSTAWGIGLIIGPALGGFLAQVQQNSFIFEGQFLFCESNAYFVKNIYNFFVTFCL